METYYVPTLAALGEVATNILTNLKTSAHDAATVLTLSGELGAGKTAFVQQLGQQLGITETMFSPTFVVMKRYQTTDPVFTDLVHIDAYRLEDESETTPLHFQQVFNEPNTLICIEWASHIMDTLPNRRATLEIIDTDGTRTLTYSSTL